MKENLTEIICVIDRSGSMREVKEDAIGGFNTLLEEQKKVEGEAHLTLVLFDTKYEFLHKSKPIDDVPPLDESTFVPRGQTALLDAVGRASGEVTERHAKMPDVNRPGKTIMVILTDGKENSSKEFNLDQIKTMVELKRQNGWVFVFLATGVNDFEAGNRAAAMGVLREHSSGYEGGSRGTADAIHDGSAAITSSRTGGDAKIDKERGVETGVIPKKT